jgi:hypothetical protein
MHSRTEAPDLAVSRASGPNPSPDRKSAAVADTIKGKIEDAGEAARDAANKAGEKIKAGAEGVADKAADAARATGQAAKDAGQKLKDKSGA